PAGAKRSLLGGDYAVFGGWPAETVARLRELPDATWIRGNVDRWAATEAPGGGPAESGIASARARDLDRRHGRSLGAARGARRRAGRQRHRERPRPHGGGRRRGARRPA